MYGTVITQEVGNGGQVCGDVEAVGYPLQNVYKMTYGDENATFEPLNLWTRERLQKTKAPNGYKYPAEALLVEPSGNSYS